MPESNQPAAKPPSTSTSSSQTTTSAGAGLSSTGANPLSEASPTSIEELFSRDPEGYNQRDLDQIVAELRQKREIWRTAEASGAKRSPKAKPGAAAPTLADLGLEE